MLSCTVKKIKNIFSEGDLKMRYKPAVICWLLTKNIQQANNYFENSY